MFVVTADQHRSTARGDRVSRVMHDLAPWHRTWRADVVLPLERTVGDEMQILLRSADATLSLVLYLCRSGDWSTGIGVGEVKAPLGDSARASTGQAFIRAREAVEEARRHGQLQRVMAVGPEQVSSEHATAMLQLLAAVIGKRRTEGWAVVDLMTQGVSRAEAARQLGISQSAVSQRVKNAMWGEELAAHPVAVSLLRAMDT